MISLKLCARGVAMLQVEHVCFLLLTLKLLQNSHLTLSTQLIIGPILLKLGTDEQYHV